MRNMEDGIEKDNPVRFVDAFVDWAWVRVPRISARFVKTSYIICINPTKFNFKTHPEHLLKIWNDVFHFHKSRLKSNDNLQAMCIDSIFHAKDSDGCNLNLKCHFLWKQMNCQWVSLPKFIFFICCIYVKPGWIIWLFQFYSKTVCRKFQGRGLWRFKNRSRPFQYVIFVLCQTIHYPWPDLIHFSNLSKM